MHFTYFNNLLHFYLMLRALGVECRSYMVCDDSPRMRSYFFLSSRRRHTRLEGVWSSDVCSSDLSLCPTWLVYRQPWCSSLSQGRISTWPRSASKCPSLGWRSKRPLLQSTVR